MEQLERAPQELHARVTQRGQVTIPVEVRRLLGVRPRDKVAFRIEDDRVHLIRSGSVVERTAGAFKSNQPLLSGKALRAAAEEAITEEAAERAGT